MDNIDSFNSRSVHIDCLPMYVAFELAFACNIRCGMCPIGTGKVDRKRTIMSREVFEKVLNSISDRPRTLCLNQVGEPLLNRNVADFVRLASERGHVVGFVTNGTLLNEEMSKALLNAGLSYLIVSFDGVTKTTYEKMRIGAVYEEVLGNVRNFSVLAQQNGGCHVGIYSIDCDITHAESPLVEGFWSGFAEAKVIPLENWGGQFDLPDAFGDIRLQKINKRHPCDILWTGLYISAEGNVMYCCNDYRHESRLTNVMEKDIKDIWIKEIRHEREKHITGQIDAPPCKNCQTWTARPIFREPAKVGIRTDRCASSLVGDTGGIADE